MTETSQNMASKTLGAALLGMVAGLGVGLLFAPRSGRDTRAQIHSKASDARHKAEEGVDNIKDQVHEMKERVTDQAKSIGHKAKQEAEKVKTKDR